MFFEAKGHSFRREVRASRSNSLKVLSTMSTASDTTTGRPSGNFSCSCALSAHLRQVKASRTGRVRA
jgi:hypothetical protein